MNFDFAGSPGWGGGHFRWGRGAGRRFGRGMMKWIVLKLLASGESHGYDFVRLFEERGWGRRAGSIYPILAALEEDGWVTCREENGKKVYTISDLGRKKLDEHAPWIAHAAAFFEGEDPEEESELKQATQKLMAAISQSAAGAKPETVAKIVERLNAARKEIYMFLANE